MNPAAVPDGGRRDNGLRAPAYVPLTDVDAETGARLLTVLGRARIAAYLVDAAVADPAAVNDASGRQRLFVDADERGDARTIVAAAVRGPKPAHPDGEPATPPDTDSAFQAIVADWRVDTIAAVREAERDLSREDADWRLRLSRPQNRDEVWLDEDHYVPPAPPPLPRLSTPTIVAMVVLVLSTMILGAGGFGVAGRATVVLGIGGLLVGAGILFTRVREYHRDEDDDGSAI